MTDAEATRWLDAGEREAWLGLAGVMLLLPSVLDSQLQRDAGLSTFEYLVLAMLSEAPARTLQLKTLAALANGSLSRLSHVVTRLEKRGWVRREPSVVDGRITVAVLTDEGYAKVVASASSHVGTVREMVFDALTPAQVGQLRDISRQIMRRLDPEGRYEPPTA
ncbi:MAG: transcriptional regulator, MarR family [Frankiales bacterium]|jgi:DNA-binding MarR family transcriptional regulator|nr:transcriptional regulator, MarR family [Frankiales bacterium]